jgi:uncharacterized iron-regulated membrane protein
MPAKPSQTVRKALQFLHLWLGLILCVPLVLLGLTGTILVFEKDLKPAQHAVATGSHQPVAAIVAAAAKAAPEHQTASMVIVPTDGGMAIVRFAQAGGNGGGRGTGPGFGAQIAVDPVSLDIATSPGAPGFMRQVHMLHANLLTPGRTGRSIIGWLGVVMLVMGISGLVIWWPRPSRWAAAFRVGRGARGIRLHRELHGAVGIWGLIVFIVVSFSGVYLAFPETVAGVIGIALPNADMRPGAPPHVAAVQDGARIDADQAVALADMAVPGGILKSVGLPMRPDQPYRIGLAHQGSGEGAPIVTVFVDPWTAKVIEIRDPATYGLGARLIAWQHATHAGDGLGPIWHLLVGLSGLLPALFAVTGISMWLLKRRARRRIAAVRGALPMAAE